MIIQLLLWSILPALGVATFIFYRDVFREPITNIIFAIAGGFLIMVPHTILFLIIGDTYYQYLDSLNEYALNVSESFYSAALVEETLKYSIFVFFISKFKAFNEPMDAIVYGVCISLGFSLMETLEWAYFNYYDYGLEAALDESIARAWSSNIMHAGCGMLMGTFLSKAFFGNNFFLIKKILALFIPIMVHGFYNLGISENYFDSLSMGMLILSYGLVFFGWVNFRHYQNLKHSEPEAKMSFSFIQIVLAISIAIALTIIFTEGVLL